MAVIGSPPGVFPQLTITQSQTWVPPQDGNVCIHVVGAGAGGKGHNITVYGGGAGAYAKIPTLAVTTSGSYTLVVGVGGVGSAGGNAGGAGGNSTIAGTGLTGTKTCGGGNAPSGSAGGAGGSVSGSGESWAGYSGGAGNYSGGAVGIFATGQTGVGGSIGNGGMTDAQSGGLAMSGYGIICGGSEMSNNLDNNNNGMPSQCFPAGDLCGGGSYIYSNQGVIATYGGMGGVGGGGGSCRNINNGNYSRAGSGGDGIILIQYLPW